MSGIKGDFLYSFTVSSDEGGPSFDIILSADGTGIIGDSEGKGLGIVVLPKSSGGTADAIEVAIQRIDNLMSAEPHKETIIPRLSLTRGVTKLIQLDDGSKVSVTFEKADPVESN